MESSSSSAASGDQLIDQPSIDDLAREIFTTTMSPYCPGLLISDCPSGKASELKVQIRQSLQSGRSTDEVRTELQEKYKASLDARPPTEGFGALMWVVPAVLLFVGALFIVRWIRAQVQVK